MQAPLIVASVCTLSKSSHGFQRQKAEFQDHEACSGGTQEDREKLVNNIFWGIFQLLGKLPQCCWETEKQTSLSGTSHNVSIYKPASPDLWQQETDDENGNDI